MSLWQEGNSTPDTARNATVSDVHFKIRCERLPIDHAFALSEAVVAAVPWLDDMPHAGVQAVHVAASQNGWERPDFASGSDLILSRRTRLKIRLDASHATQLIESLCNQTLQINGHTLHILSGQHRAITPAETLFSRYTLFHEAQLASDEESLFVNAVINWCEQQGFRPSKLLCGKSHLITTQYGLVNCRSVMIADVPAEHSLRLQEVGIGDLRRMGCGIVLPHKDTGTLHP